MFQELTINITGLNIAAKLWGKPDGIPVIALHGWLDNANSFDFLAPLLRDFTILAIDLPGHGLSSHLPSGCHYHFIDAVAYLFEIADSIHWDKFALLGHSMGGGIATLAAGTFPARITHNILIEGFGPLTAVSNSAPSQLAKYILQYENHKNKNIRYYPNVEAAANNRAADGYLSVEFAKVLCARGCSSNQHGVYWRHDRKLQQPTSLRLTEPQVLAFIKEIMAPTCLINASNGFKYDPNMMQRRLHSISTAVIHEISGGHHIHMEQAKQVATIIKDFFKN